MPLTCISTLSRGKEPATGQQVGLRAHSLVLPCIQLSIYLLTHFTLVTQIQKFLRARVVRNQFWGLASPPRVSFLIALEKTWTWALFVSAWVRSTPVIGSAWVRPTPVIGSAWIKSTSEPVTDTGGLNSCVPSPRCRS